MSYYRTGCCVGAELEKVPGVNMQVGATAAAAAAGLGGLLLMVPVILIAGLFVVALGGKKDPYQ